jgi:hypothetical protein
VQSASGLSHQNYVLQLAYAVLMATMSKDDRMVTKLHTGGHLDVQLLENG